MLSEHTRRKFRIFAFAGIALSIGLKSASAQPSNYPGQRDPSQADQGGMGSRGGPSGPGGVGGPGGRGGQRPRGMPPGFVPGDALPKYLGLSAAQKQKLTDLMKTMDALGQEHVPPTTFEQLHLSEAAIKKIASGAKLTDVLTSDQQQTMNANRRPDRRGGRGGPGAPGGLGGAGGVGGADRQDGPDDGPNSFNDSSREVSAPVATPGPLAAGVTRVPITFTGGYETDPRDGGRPVVLVANGLGVTPEVFREAFSHVHPARNGNEPEPEQVRQNKAALMNALGKYGIDNDQIDTVSNYYRYVRSRNELWTHTPAVANALVKDGAVIGVEILRNGAGYSSPPTVSIPNVRSGNANVKLAFSKVLTKNGAIESITFH